MSGNSQIIGYEELTGRRSPKGRFYLFEAIISIGGGKKIKRHYVNSVPYPENAEDSPPKLYRMIDDYGGRFREVGRGKDVDWNAVDAVISGHERPKVNLSKATVAETPQELKQDLQRNEDDGQDDLPGLSWDSPSPKRPGGHWASHAMGVRVADTWTKGQMYCGKDGCYDVGILTGVSSGNEVVRTKVSSLFPQLKENAWGTPEIPVTPLGVLSNPTFSAAYMKHMATIRTADLSKPIIIRLQDGVVMDGNHRLARCVLEGREWIEAVYVHEEQMTKAKIISY
jgi:hypothetical protein